MNDVAVLVGGKAGDGINSAGAMVAQLLNFHGYSVYGYLDYPSLIRGGHNFTIIRGSDSAASPGTCRKNVDFVLALNQETVERHRDRWNPDTVLVVNTDFVKAKGHGISVREILASEHAPDIMGNSAIIGGFAKTAGIGWELVESVFRAHIPKGADLNLAVAKRAYDHLGVVHPVPRGSTPRRPILTGNEAIGLGLVRGGLDTYVSYPMTPSSGILHFLAGQQERFGITVVHPESEIAVILMALGFAYAGKRAAVGTSGGGFCLMTEGLSLAGMAEVPVVLVVSQRTGPSTGLPTYTGQSDLRFILHAGHGEFPRLVVAPGDAAEAMLWSSRAVELAWRYQVPAFILADKTLSEGMYSMDLPLEEEPAGKDLPLRDKSSPYLRYASSPSGISPLAFPGTPGAVVKVNGYSHDESGITTEEAGLTKQMAEKRVQKEHALREGMTRYGQVHTAGEPDAATAFLCWGSTGGVCTEVAEMLGLRVIRPLVLSPFPVAPLNAALGGVQKIIAVEENATGQLAAVSRCHGIAVQKEVLKYDGRPFAPEELADAVRKVIA
jgi:2-oxoglutarate ferredoxin oxidoreductase subunit alpha